MREPFRFTLTCGAVVTVDAEDAWVANHYWQPKKGNASRGGNHLYRMKKIDGRPRSVFLHREILGIPIGDPRVVDHVSGDTYDNRRCNLRIVTRSQNNQNRRGANRNNSTGVRNVRWLPSKRRFQAEVETPDGKYLSRTTLTLREAAEAAKALRAVAGFIGGAEDELDIDRLEAEATARWGPAVIKCQGRQESAERRCAAKRAARGLHSLGSGQALFVPARREEQPSLGFGGAA